jgi:hypothetical protein
VSWIQKHLRILPPPIAATFAEALALIRSKATEAERSRLASADMTGKALEMNITATESWEKHLVDVRAQARQLGVREGRGFAEIEAGIELAVEDGLRNGRRA